MITLIAVSRFIAMESNYETKKRKEEQNEFANSVQKDTNSTASHRTSACRDRVAYRRTRGRRD